MYLAWRASKEQSKVFYLYYIIVVAVYLAQVYYFGLVRSGILMTIVMLYLAAGSKILEKGRKSNALVGAFLIYNIFSIQGYLYNGIPISAYIADFTNQTMPILFFFIATSLKSDKDKFYDYFLFAMIIANVIGLYFYLFPSSAYISYASRTFNSGFEGQLDANQIMRYNSLFGSTAMGSLCIFSFVMLLQKYIYNNPGRFKSRFVVIVLAILSFLFAFLTSQRSSMVMVVFCAMCYYLLSLRVKKGGFFKLTFILVLIILLVLPYAASSFGDLFDFWGERLESLDTATEGRDTQWVETITHSKNIILGTGLGSVGGKAVGFTPYTITDGGLFKYLAEFGIIGFVFFLYLLGTIILSNIKYYRPLFCEYLIVLVCLAQSVGSNTICFQVTAPIFWYCLGIIASYQYGNGNHSILSTPISSHTA